MTLDPAGLEAAAKAIAERVADDQEYERLEQTFQRDADAAVRAYLAAAVPAPTTENPPGEAIGEIARQAAVAGYDAGFAAGRSALSPLVKDYSDALTDADDHVSVLLSHAAAALERADVGDAEEATAILRAVVNLDGSPVAAGRAAATPDPPEGETLALHLRVHPDTWCVLRRDESVPVGRLRVDVSPSAAATPDPPEPNAAIRALMAAYNDSQSHAFRAAMVTAAGVIGQHYGDENPNADEFDGAGCCPEEDGFLRAKARAAATPTPSDEEGWSPGIDDPEPPALGDIDTGEGWYQT